MTDIWICKDDGTIQCQDQPEITVEKMGKFLASIIGEDNILDQEKRSRNIIQLCGMPTGKENAYKITEEGACILFFGISGPLGFSACIETDKDRSIDKEDNVAQILQDGRFNSVLFNPTLIRELIGRPVRTYIEGTPITMDYIPKRVNIKTDQSGNIIDIWFG